MRRSFSRRAVIVTAGSAVSAAALGLPALAQSNGAHSQAANVHIRLLETSDLHMFVLDWDYYRVKPDPTVGFARIASLIRAARQEPIPGRPAATRNTLLFDNGDLIQGSPLADYIVEQRPPTAADPHPMTALMTAYGYDAATLGNHEFNYGLDLLEAALAGANFPFVLSNVTRADGSAFLPVSTILNRIFVDTEGAEVPFRIGIVGFVPPQILQWDKARIEGKLLAQDIVAAARQHVPKLRADCDLLVALCHAGISTAPYTEGMENAAFHLAAVPGIDVIFTGHQHRVFPGKDYEGQPGVDAVGGRLNGVPAVMPGFWGSHLGIVDLVMARDAAGAPWRVTESKVETRSIYKREQGKVVELTTADAAVAAAIKPVHEGTLKWVEQPVGAVDKPVHSYFVWAGHDPATALVNAAQAWYAKPLLAGTPEADLPLLSAVAPFRAGYTPDSFIDFPAGRTALRQVADLYLYSNNTVVIVEVTGAELKDWLEYSSSAFLTIDPAAAATPQPLVNKKVPSFNFDIIAGVTYRIDVSKRPRYPAKDQIDPAGGRIVDLMYGGKPVDPAARFAVVTNNHRADGGGSFPALKTARTLLRAPDTNRDAVLRYFRSREVVPVPTTFPWSFAPLAAPVAVYFDTGTPATLHLTDAPGLTATGPGEPGYLRVQMLLG